MATSSSPNPSAPTLSAPTFPDGEHPYADMANTLGTVTSLPIRGRLVLEKGIPDLRASTQDLRVLVSPELSGGLATLAYAAIVNPAVGLGAFLAQSIFSQPLSRALAHEFEITGSWANPTVIQRRREPLATPKGE